MKFVLDFGAGWRAIHRDRLINLCDYVAWDFGRNYDPTVHNPRALDFAYDVVFASNVLNVHHTDHALLGTIAQMAQATKGLCFANYPASPRKGDFSVQTIEDSLRRFFTVTRRVRSTQIPTWVCSAPNNAAAFNFLVGFRFTIDEQECANIRPVGAVGKNAIVPRLVQRYLEGGSIE